MGLDDNPFSSSEVRSVDGAGRAAPVPMDVGAILTRAWDIAIAHPTMVLGAVLLPLIPAVGLGGIGAVIDIYAETAELDGAMAIVAALIRIGVNLLAQLVGLFFQLGMVRIFLGLVREQEVDLGMLVGEGGKYLPALAAYVLMAIVSVLGLLLFIVPGIVVALGLQFTLYLLVDRDLGPIEAMQESWALTNGYKFTIFLINLVIGLLGIAIFCATCGIGYLLVVPVLSLVQAVMYQSLLHLRASSADRPG